MRLDKRCKIGLILARHDATFPSLEMRGILNHRIHSCLIHDSRQDGKCHTGLEIYFTLVAMWMKTHKY